ncbi:MAG: LacI family DNA-binding transcriptional regulator [Bifidobacterium aquikefiri]|uniref:Bacterial regulatory protein, LacI family n=1 Tax=Bifidobacterium aquikefiri TaxID=1653207 RepID=A0A261G152_9BIFI|nr:LacI family DNA-binding transcriptional regulator [Bifidobacterium aquikefiri]OZG65147.1 bacterial regulatory protein, LacI family [Bifidobacterium aquikefiri]
MNSERNRVTISDVAKASGVSNSAVSYALNGKAGVSSDTRQQVLAVAQRMGWRPNSAAKALSDAATHSVGMILTYAMSVLSVESYTTELMAGLTAELERKGYSLLIRSSSSHEYELTVLQEWIASGAVDAVLVLNVELNDPRISLLQSQHRIPALALCNPMFSQGLPSLSSNESDAAHLIIDYLHELGHTRIARVAGPERLGHTFIRDNAFMEEAAALGLQYSCLHADYSPEDGLRCTKRLLSLPHAPTAIVYDNDVMALSALKASNDMGIAVPEALSIVSWDDSFMCEVSVPSITALNRNVVGTGRLAAQLILQLIEGKDVDSVSETDNELVFRESSGPVHK